jgi:hypothetical protein
MSFALAINVFCGKREVLIMISANLLYTSLGYCLWRGREGEGEKRRPSRTQTQEGCKRRMTVLDGMNIQSLTLSNEYCTKNKSYTSKYQDKKKF